MRLTGESKDRSHWVPYLNGERIHDCILADTEIGVVITQPRGKAVFRRYGRVELLDTRTGRVVRGGR